VFFFTPRYLKEAKHARHAGKKILNYRRDVLPAQAIAEIESAIAGVASAAKARDRAGVKSAIEDLERAIGEAIPAREDGWIAENVEVFVVAIVIAAGIRAYFLQPFKIPTGSMQPTLYGVVGTRTETPPPNILRRVAEFVWLGRSYLDVVAKQDDVVVGLKEKPLLNFFVFTEIACERSTYTVFAPPATIQTAFGITRGREIKAGEPIVRGYVDTGDQVFVDKMSYQFVAPARGNVFVFKTTGIRHIEMGFTDPRMGSQYYIKRLAGLPGDQLRIDSPDLYVNGKLATEPAFLRVMAAKGGYRGYSNTGLQYLTTPEETFTVPPKSFFALGDNSYNSSDSRFWGIVPERNVAGRGLFVYWPFSSRWGLIH